MNKKSIITIILAIILAFLTAYFVFNKKTVTETPEIKTESPVQEKIEKSIVDNKIQSNENKKTEKKETKELIIKVIETPTIKPLKVVVKDEAQEEKNTDAGIIKDEVSNEIVITREFKIQSPAKYSFVGYGEQKAPTK